MAVIYRRSGTLYGIPVVSFCRRMILGNEGKLTEVPSVGKFETPATRPRKRACSFQVVTNRLERS